MNKNLMILLSGALALSVITKIDFSNAGWRDSNNGENVFSLDYYAKKGNPIGGEISSARARGEICQSGIVEIVVRHPSYQFRNGNFYPLHGDEANNAANLFCRSKGLDYAKNVEKAEGPKVLTLEAHWDTFEVDGHHTTVTSLTCVANVQQPCTTFNKDMLTGR